MDARRHERIRLIYHLRVFNAETHELLGYLVDITTSGMMLVGESPLTVGQSIRVQMELPRNVMDGGQVSFTGVVKWSRAEGSGSFYSVGLELQRVSCDAVRLVRQLTDRFHQAEIADSEAERADPFAQTEDPEAFTGE